MARDAVYGIPVIEVSATSAFMLPQTIPTYTYDTSAVTFTLRQAVPPMNVVLDKIPLTVNEAVALPLTLTITLSGRYLLFVSYVNAAGITVDDEYYIVFSNLTELE